MRGNAERNRHNIMSFSRTDLKPWELAIIDKYPLIFTEDTDGVKSIAYRANPETFVSLRSGFEHGEGWSSLIIKIADVGTKLVTHLRANGFPSSYISSCICKEKFGTLNWQGDRDLPEPFEELWRAYVSKIESESTFICEITGEYGTLCRSESGWLKTLSREKAKELGYVDCEDHTESKNKPEIEPK